MNDVPLVKDNNINSINTSLIAIKKQLKQLTEAIGLIDVPDVDTSVFVKKSEVVDAVESGNMNPVTSNAVVPVDEVALNNIHSVTSNAVATSCVGVPDYSNNIYAGLNQTSYTIQENMVYICFLYMSGNDINQNLQINGQIVSKYDSINNNHVYTFFGYAKKNDVLTYANGNSMHNAYLKIFKVR